MSTENISEGSVVRLVDGRVGVIGLRRPSPNPSQPNYEIHFRLCRLVTNEIAEILEAPPDTYPRGEGPGLYPDLAAFVRATDSRVSLGR